MIVDIFHLQYLKKHQFFKFDNQLWSEGYEINPMYESFVQLQSCDAEIWKKNFL